MDMLLLETQTFPTALSQWEKLSAFVEEGPSKDKLSLVCRGDRDLTDTIPVCPTHNLKMFPALPWVQALQIP